MKATRRKRRRRRNKAVRLRTMAIVLAVSAAIVVLIAVSAIRSIGNRTADNEGEAGGQSLLQILGIGDEDSAAETPPELLTRYMSYIEGGDYEGMYSLIDTAASGDIAYDSFYTRNSAIYEGIEARDIAVNILFYDEDVLSVSYDTTMQTAAGEVTFQNKAFFTKSDDGYSLIWDDRLIFPELTADERVRVSTTEARRGEIYDRNGRLLAGRGTASSVGVVPGKLEDREAAIAQLAALLGMDADDIERRLSAEWVRDDYFVPLATIPRISELDMMSDSPDQSLLDERSRQAALLAIPGVMLSDTEVRCYPLAEAAAHLIGYVRGVTAEDIEEHSGEGYAENSVIGKSGLEALYEEKLRGVDGCEIYIADANGNKKRTVAMRPVQNGSDIRLTIDASLQGSLYEQFKDDMGCSVALDPYTGEVLALVSTPSYDDNAFIFGMSEEKWAAISEDERLPMYNRFRAAYAPGSTFKPVIAEIGLDCGAIDPDFDYGNEGISWQKDASWGSYYVTTLHTYEPVTMENAIIYSDNIYFAKAALRIGSERLESSLDALGFGEPLPFDILMTASQYAGDGHISSEIQLADSGYGQGEVLVNPLHLACIYTTLCNGGAMLAPRLLYDESAEREIWIEGAFSPEAAEAVRQATIEVINNPEGTGRAARRNDIVLAGKTGTAELKEAKDDADGTELGWFVVYTADPDTDRPLLLLSMVEDVKDIGGSGYVVEKDKAVMDGWLDRL